MLLMSTGGMELELLSNVTKNSHLPVKQSSDSVLCVCVTSQSRKIVTSTAAAAQSAGHRRVVQVLIHFTAVILVLVSLRLLRSEKKTESVHSGFTNHCWSEQRKEINKQCITDTLFLL